MSDTVNNTLNDLTTMYKASETVATTIIVGSGVVGACMALKLAQAKHKVVLIDAQPSLSDEAWQARLAQRDSRVFALNLASIALLQEIGVWQHIKQQQRKVDYTQMHVWQKNGFGELRFAENSNHVNHVRLGSMIEPSVIEYALYQRMQDSDVACFIDIMTGQTLLAIDERYNELTRETDCVVTVLANGNKTLISGTLLIGADGRNSAVRRLSAIDVDSMDYEQTAICCAIKTEKPHDRTARQAMLPTGTLALLPLADTDAHHGSSTHSGDKLNQDYWHSVVWTLPTYLAIEMNMLNDKQLAEELTVASSYELGRVVEIESINSFPLIAQQAKTYIKTKRVLIGDAAHSIHPLAGQGLNLGLSDVHSLSAQLLADHKRMTDLHLKGNWGHWQTLQRYERDRKPKNSQMMHGCSLLNWTFAGYFAQLSPLLQIRSEGMAMVNKNRWLMNWFNEKASGL